MLKRITILAVSLCLTACRTIAQSNPMPEPSTSPGVNSSASVGKALSGAELSAPQCQGEVPSSIKIKLRDYRLAQPSDFVASIRASERENPHKKLTCSIFTADFNQDGLPDYALLLVNPKTQNFRFVMAINQGNGKFEPAVLKDFHPLANSDQGIIYTSMLFKPSGSLGAAKREYSPLKYGTSDEQIFKAQTAIELWKPLSLNPTGMPQDLNVSTLAYCSDIFYFVDRQLKTFGVCD